MARPKKDVPSRPVDFLIPGNAYARLEFLARLGMHGDSPTDVARFLISDGLAKLWREGKIPDELPE
jgi:hypothetical protein